MSLYERFILQSDGHFTASVGCTTSLERLSEFEIRVRSLNNVVDEDNKDMAYEAGVFWKEFNVENKVNYHNTITISLKIHFI